MTINDFFEGRPACLRLYHVVEAYLQSLGPVRIDVTKTQVSFRANFMFAAVWLPQKLSPIRSQNGIGLSFSLTHPVSHPRIVQAVEVRPRRWTHHVLLEQAEDLDEDIRALLRESFAFGSLDRRARRLLS
jgi:hypothetical protein